MVDLQTAKPITLPCGLTFPNRLAKAAIAEGWGDKEKLPHKDLIDTYNLWADGGWGMLMTGNVQVDVTHMGTPDDNAVNDQVDRERHISSWKRWAAVAGRNGTPIIMQICHPGRQSSIGAGSRSLLAKTIAPSAVPVKLGDGIIAKAASAIAFGRPREISISEIELLVHRFAKGAQMAHEAGFAGVQIHAAHGYLLAQFLSLQTNKRSDIYGGTAKNRAKIVVDVICAIRRVVPKTFCVGIKLNSVNHQNEGELKDCLEQLEDIINIGIDFLEISGGTYENPVMLAATTSSPDRKVSATTAVREAFFLDFAKTVRRTFPNVPLMVTGGFRSRLGMEQALQGACDIIGLARPAVIDPLLPKEIIFNSAIPDADARLITKSFAQPWLAKQLGMKGLSGGTETV
ncbi:Aldolase-type TIM barrel [Metarhizium guizhouense ARSEF 977]|uniref:Aldolase-type TIM barrel n=1 Tax=Metarhizium guizhouense (strain ARSEF 977) TaxID=1276136 RepID=A0A0B4GPW6_METGA|nr:Aldolase-type TIM barrel [Metarhizium guizhouense ARSEF 977]